MCTITRIRSVVLTLTRITRRPYFVGGNDTSVTKQRQRTWRSAVDPIYTHSLNGVPMGTPEYRVLCSAAAKSKNMPDRVTLWSKHSRSTGGKNRPSKMVLADCGYLAFTLLDKLLHTVSRDNDDVRIRKMTTLGISVPVKFVSGNTTDALLCLMAAKAARRAEIC